jgi:hypothetical protein
VLGLLIGCHYIGYGAGEILTKRRGGTKIRELAARRAWVSWALAWPGKRKGKRLGQGALGWGGLGAGLAGQSAGWAARAGPVGLAAPSIFFSFFTEMEIYFWRLKNNRKNANKIPLDSL